MHYQSPHYKSYTTNNILQIIHYKSYTTLNIMLSNLSYNILDKG